MELGQCRQRSARRQRHGTHTASIAAGNHVVASLFGGSLTRNLSGVAPHANLISYDVCDSDGYCDDYDVLDAIEQSVADGVDVISMAISDYEYSPWYSSVSQALLGARGAGIFVAAALQDYDDAGSPGNAPWLLGVAATSHDRRLTSALSSLSGGTNPPADFPAQSLTSSYGPAAIVSAGSFGSSYCGSPFPAGTFNGQIVVCEYSPWDSELAIGQNVLAGGAGGLVLATYHGTPSAQQAPNVLPAVLLSAAQGDQLLSWLSSGGGGRTARITGTTAQSVPSLADRLWSGSPPGYGYYSDLFDFLKPDVAAPGQEILAAHIDPSG
ncbi:MAG TPA: S8 family serine peptidase, partial [Thermoanaerobaculia bacterium]|nr:S8 family serine peptidase [Thermoanaerobaculia bacterium]